jgi:hypothetical protein
MVYEESYTRERENEISRAHPTKVYVGVFVKITDEGKTIPYGLQWTDQKIYRIDRILDVRKAASLKAGGCGMRYTCMICGKKVELFDEEGRWFVTPAGR